MKAVVATAVGGPEQLSFGDWPEPDVGPNDVLIEVKAAGVNRADIWLRTGLLGPLPIVPGIDAAGVIVARGAAVTGIAEGARVLVNPAVTCGQCAYCLSGRHGICREKRSIGQRLDGSYAQYVKVPALNVHTVADELSLEEAAAIPSAFFTAWHVLAVRAQLKPEDTILITAAASGVGSAAIQLAKLFGARVIAVASSTVKLERARQWGADETISYRSQNVASRVLELTDGEGVDVVVDIVGASMWATYLDCVRPGGRIVTCSFVGGREGQADIYRLIARQISILGSGPQGAKAEAAKVVSLFNRGLVHGVIDRTFPLRDAAQAQAMLERNEVIGKLLLIP